jgi:hypothetical protein
MTVFYKRSISCDIVSIKTEYENDKIYLLVKLKPYGSNNFYIHEVDPDEKTRQSFINAYDKGKTIKFTFELEDEKE